jgi:xanthine dehydrogenase YagS FAD-binding subunit
LEAHALVRERFTALSEAAGLAATPQLRNMATLGGNLLQRPRCWYYRSPLFRCWLKGGDECQAREGENQQHAIFPGSPCVAVHPSDPAAALLALDARVQIGGRRGERTLALSEFFRLPSDAHRRETVLEDDELLFSIVLPAPPEGMRSTYLKAMNRRVWAFALVGVAAALRVDGGRIVEARLVLGGVAPIPLRFRSAEQILIGSNANEATFDRATGAALADAEPLSKNRYKLALARGKIRQALRKLA